MNTELSSRDWLKINQLLDFVYQRFTALVSKSRNPPLEKVEKIAKGRVWTGEQAQALGLVDQLGSLEDAIALARVEAGLPEDAPITIIPKPKSLAEKVLALISGEERLKYDGFLSSGLAPLITLVQELRALTRMISPLHSTEAEIFSQQRI